MESDRQFSIYVSRALDCLGNSKEMVKYRVEWCTKNDHYKTSIKFSNLKEYITAGSTGEGLVAPFESDHDIMTVIQIYICTDNTAPLRYLTVPLIVLEAVMRKTSPGYTMLKLDQTRPRILRSYLDNSFLEDGHGNLFLSSDVFFEIIRMVDNMLPPNNFQTLLKRSGPSLPSVGFLKYSQDFVVALPCFLPKITQSFIERNRNYGWPTTDQLNELSNLEGHVVPVGYKGSHTASLEWRICYTKSERFLMRSLNDTQVKIYILLKMVTKTYIKLVCKEITSYILKNIVLWQAECNSIDTFNEDLLVNRLIQALLFLRNCIINNNLPSYMIPERNLFSEKLVPAQRQKIVVLLTGLIYKGGGLLMGLERLRANVIVLYKAPAVAEQYRRKRDMIEKLYLLQDNIVSEKRTSSAAWEQILRLLSTDAVFLKLSVTLYDLVMPDRLSLLLQGHDASSMLRVRLERQTQWLS